MDRRLAAVMIAAGQLSYWFLVGEVRPQKAGMAIEGGEASPVRA